MSHDKLSLEFIASLFDGQDEKKIIRHIFDEQDEKKIVMNLIKESEEDEAK